jgi:glycosyltransferase involved in cell wall biosynthesis
MPTVSIIIPAYNAEKTILETIQSLQNQTFSDFEVIVVNDGSTDKTLEVLAAIADPRLKVVSHANSGVAVTRNRGIAEATGEFIAFVDADDLWTPDKLESQLKALQANPEAGVAYSWTTFIDQQGKVLFSQDPVFETGNVYPRLLVGNITSNGSNILARRQFVEAVGGFDSEVRPAEDWDYCIRLAALCPFVVVPKHQILYRQMARSHSSKVDVMERCSLAIIEKSFRAAPAELQYLKSKSLGNTYRYLTKLCLIHTSSDEDVRKASEMLNKAVRVYPKSLFDRQIQRLLIEVKLMRLLSYKTSVHFEQFLAKLFPKFAGKFLLLVNKE